MWVKILDILYVWSLLLRLRGASNNIASPLAVVAIPFMTFAVTVRRIVVILCGAHFWPQGVCLNESE